MAKKTKKKREPAPRVAHVDFVVDKEKQFIKYVKYLSSPGHIMWRNFLAGAFRGVGFLLGSALIIALIGFLVNDVISNVPIFRELSQAIDIWLESTLESGQ
jgi:hypothetical protein